MELISVLPWSRINDYLVDIGSAENINDFCRRVLTGLLDLVPFDNNGIFATSDKSGFIAQYTFVESAKWSELYNNYYCRIQTPELNCKTSAHDLRDLPQDEYIVDFLYPQGIGHTATLYGLGNKGIQGGLAIHRSKNSTGFTGQDLLILNIIQPHISNYFSIYSLLATYDSQLPDAGTIASGYKCLTRREAEIASLICRRFSTGMIASRLLISNLTVYKHVENIYEKLKVFTRDELINKVLVDFK